MANYEEHLLIYLNLARHAKQKLRMSEYYRLMILSATAAYELELKGISAYCRQLILKNNPGHMIGRYPTMDEARANPDFQYFLSQVRRQFPIEYAETELEKLGVDYRDDLVDAGTVEAYLSGLLGVEYEWILEHFGD